MKKQLENALRMISVPSDLDKAVEKGIMRAKNERKGIKMTKNIKAIASIAAAFVVCGTVCVGAAVAGGHLVDIKDGRGAITGQQFVDATDYFNVSLSYSQNDNKLKLETDLTEAAKNDPYFGSIESIRPAEFSLVDNCGNVVAESSDDGTLDFEFAESAFTEDGALTYTFDVNGKEGVENYKVFVNKLIGSRKGDQDVEIFGNWADDVDVVFTFVENGADPDDPNASISRVEVDSDGNVTYYNEKGETVAPQHGTEFSANSSSTWG